MYFQKVITNIRHQDRRLRTVVDDFFVMDVGVWAAADALGMLQGDYVTMRRMVDWASDPHSQEYVFLISLDGKHGVIALAENVNKPEGNSEIVFLKNGFNADLVEFRKLLLKAMANDPEFAEKVEFRAPQRSIPDRISFLGMKDDFRPETIEREINDALSNVESASDDALVWLAIISNIPGNSLDKRVIEAVDRELQMRLEKRSEFRSTFFPLDKVTIQEISARSRRANRDFENCRQKFPLGQDARDEEMHRYARGLSNDRLADLCAVLYYQDNWGQVPFKHLLMQLYDRIRRALGRN